MLLGCFSGGSRILNLCIFFRYLSIEVLISVFLWIQCIGSKAHIHVSGAGLSEGPS